MVADRVDAVKVSALKERWTEFLLPYIQYHTRYEELSRRIFLKIREIYNIRAGKVLDVIWRRFHLRRRMSQVLRNGQQ